MIEQELTPPPTERAGAAGYLRLMLVFGAWLLIIGGFQAYAWRQMLTPAELMQNLVESCRAGAAGPLIFIGAAALSPLLLIPAAVLGGIGGVCFGPLDGVLFTLIGCNLSALATYGLGRWSSRDDNRMTRLCERYGQRLRQRPFLSILLLRLSFLPYDPINYLIGMLRVRIWVFLLANTLGSLPGVIAIVLAGAAVGGIRNGLPLFDPAILVGAVILLLTSVVVAFSLRRRNNAP